MLQPINLYFLWARARATIPWVRPSISSKHSISKLYRYTCIGPYTKTVPSLEGKGPEEANTKFIEGWQIPHAAQSGVSSLPLIATRAHWL